MEDIQIKLAFIWTALMLTYLLGDVLRIFAGDFKAGEIEGKKITSGMWLGISVLMVMPIIMIVLSITLDSPINRILNIMFASFFFIFNLFGLPTYKGSYDKFLIVVGLVFNLLTIWLAWNWN